MVSGTYQNQEVVDAEVIQVRARADYPGQRRAYNYVVRLNTVDVETGEPVMQNEYRSLASDRQLSNETVLNRMIELIEESL